MKFFRKTKIIATFGPALMNEDIFTKAMKAGVNVIRFNFSHLNPSSAKNQMQWVERQLKKIGHQVAFLADLKGPEIRTNEHVYNLKKNENIVLQYAPKNSSIPFPDSIRQNVIGIDHPKLYRLIAPNQKILADDGFFEFKVTKIENQNIYAKVIHGGELKPRKSIIVPNVDLDLPILNQTDREDLDFISQGGFSWVAASFVNCAQNVKDIRNHLAKKGCKIPIISKIENHKGISNIDEILDASDGLMVARGDLGLEYPFAEVPILQEKIITKAKIKGKVVIVATQMLNSMIEEPRPTRPEVSDISYAIRSQVDAVMLSGETATGKYPNQAVITMAQIIEKSESFFTDKNLTLYESKNRLVPFCQMAIRLAFAINAKCLIAISRNGKSPLYLSAFRSFLINVVATENPKLFYRCFLYYSVYPILFKKKMGRENAFINIIDQCKQKGYLKKGEKFIHIYTHESKHISQKNLLATNSIREEIVE